MIHPGFTPKLWARNCFFIYLFDVLLKLIVYYIVSPKVTKCIRGLFITLPVITGDLIVVDQSRLFPIYLIELSY